MLSRRDDGFTLIELLVAVVILGVIMVPLATVMIGYLRNTDSIAARFGESHDQQIATAYWQQDVSSIGVRSSTYDQASHTFPLRPSVNTAFPCPATGLTSVVVLSWNHYDSSGSATPISVGYFTDASRTQLIRLHCTGSTVDSTAVLAHELDPSTPPVVTCSSTCADANVPTSVSLAMSVKDSSGNGLPYSVTLTGQRRQT